MSYKSIAELFSSYKNQRAVKFNEGQFTTFAVFFPALLVINSDEVVDIEEWDYTMQLAKYLANTYQSEGLSLSEVEELNKAYVEESGYLLKNLKFWESKFIEALKAYVAENPEAKDAILDTIYLFAEASSGVSEVEKNKIIFIKKELLLEE